ncbi:MAG: hypothetical protein H6R15_1489 [Proteobacteria bacterium]|nr:hypothetical protein [Pseudomonadota bacterium]
MLNDSLRRSLRLKPNNKSETDHSFFPVQKPGNRGLPLTIPTVYVSFPTFAHAGYDDNGIIFWCVLHMFLFVGLLVITPLSCPAGYKAMGFVSTLVLYPIVFFEFEAATTDWLSHMLYLWAAWIIGTVVIRKMLLTHMSKPVQKGPN